MDRLTILFVLVFLVSAALPAHAAGNETPATEALGPDTGLFHVHIAKDFECGIAAAEMAGTDVEGAYHYLTNVAADPCAKTAEDIEGSVFLPADAAVQIRLVPFLEQTVELVAGEPVTATIWIWTEHAGTVSPYVTLEATGWASTIEEGEHVSPTDLELAPGGRTWHRFDLDFGPSPGSFGAGTVTLRIDLDVGADELRRLGAPRVGIGATGDHKSTLTLPLDVQVDEPVDPVLPWPPALETATVRPGVQHVTSGAQCTTNFVFRDLDTEKLYMGTAAHCVDHVPIGSKSIIRATGSGSNIEATVAFSTGRTSAVGSDFALLEIPKDREQDVHPAVIHFGGPTHLAHMPTVNTLDKVLTYGNSGMRPGPGALDWHEGYVTGKSLWYTRVYTVTPGIFGDSGSGVMTKDGGAIGAASFIYFAPVPGENGFGNIPPVISWMNANGWNLELQTWELLDPGVLPAPQG